MKRKAKEKTVGLCVGFTVNEDLATKAKSRFGSLNRAATTCLAAMNELFEKEIERVLLGLSQIEIGRATARASMVAGWPASAMMNPAAVAEALQVPAALSMSPADALILSIWATAQSHRGRVKV